MENLHDISRLIGQLEAKVEAGNRNRESQGKTLEHLGEQHAELKSCIELLRATVEKQSEQIDKISKIADDYTHLKAKGVGILMIIGLIAAGLWEGAKLALKKFGV